MSRRRAASALLRCIAVGAWLWPSALCAVEGALEIEFDYRFDRTGFFASADRKAALERAADAYEHRIAGRLGALEAGEWIAELPLPETGEFVTVSELGVREDTLVVFVGARSLAVEGRLALGGPGAWRVPCAELFGFPMPRCDLQIESVGSNPLAPLEDWMGRVLFRARPSARRFPAQGFAPWGGFLVFDAAVDWYFGLDTRIPRGRADFVSAAIHELGHVLGVGTAESWGTHTPGNVFVGGAVEELLGSPAALAPDLAHWREETLSVGDAGVVAAAFNPGLTTGERRDLTELDVAALVDIGWSLLADEVGPAVGPFAYDEPFAGDLNADGQLDALDVEILAAYLEEPLSARALAEADVASSFADGFTGDGYVDAYDVALLDRALYWLDLEESGRLDDFICDGLPFGLCVIPDPSPTGWFPVDSQDHAAFRLLGWGISEFGRPETGAGPPRGGDLNGDGVLDFEDRERVARQADRGRLLDGAVFAAADVAPMVDGNSLGDGLVDMRDLDLLIQALTERDIDGDGFSTALENAANRAWMESGLGRPRHRPLTRWTDECLAEIEVLEGHTVLEAYLGALFGGEEAPPELRFDFCSRDGSPWSTQPAVSREAYRALRRDADRSVRRAGPSPTRDGMGVGSRSDAAKGSDETESAAHRSGGFGWRASGPETAPPPETVKGPMHSASGKEEALGEESPSLEPAAAELPLSDDTERELASRAWVEGVPQDAGRVLAEPARARFWRAVERMVASLIQTAWSLITAWLTLLD